MTQSGAIGLWVTGRTSARTTGYRRNQFSILARKALFVAEISPPRAGPARQNHELRPVTEFGVAPPLQGFVHALGVLENVRTQFAEQGLIGLGGSPEGGSPPPPPKPTKSPNFS
jgi:hypothetical protein